MIRSDSNEPVCEQEVGRGLEGVAIEKSRFHLGSELGYLTLKDEF
jgi:hypothetical protein